MFRPVLLLSLTWLLVRLWSRLPDALLARSRASRCPAEEMPAAVLTGGLLFIYAVSLLGTSTSTRARTTARRRSDAGRGGAFTQSHAPRQRERGVGATMALPGRPPRLLRHRDPPADRLAEEVRLPVAESNTERASIWVHEGRVVSSRQPGVSKDDPLLAFLRVTNRLSEGQGAGALGMGASPTAVSRTCSSTGATWTPRNSPDTSSGRSSTTSCA